GVAYTADAGDPAAATMTISAVPGLADRMVKGEVPADTFLVSRRPPRRIVQAFPASHGSGGGASSEYLPEARVIRIADLVCQAAEKFGHELDIEWAMDKGGVVWLLQARRLAVAGPDAPAVPVRKDDPPLLEGGITIFPGRAEGPLMFLEADAPLSGVPEGTVVLVEQPRPELASILPKIAALLVMEGNPVGHLATLVREFSVPCIFRVGHHASALAARNVVSVNATRRRVYDGSRWPGIRERVMARIGAGGRRPRQAGPLYDLVLGLNLLDPDAASFKAKSCRSVHDTLRFMHEMSVQAMFGFGDRQRRGPHGKSRKLTAGLPIHFQLIDLDRCIPEELKKVTPNNVDSIPFQALWRGMSDSRLVWSERWERAMRGMPSDFKEAVLGGNKGPRRPSDRNYAIVAGDYINLNARFAYHYAMIDAMVGPGADHNHVHFRFRGGGGRDENRQRRARFLERVLREMGFGVDRSGDLVTAWLRRYPRKDSEEALVRLGRLSVCARQLDAILQTDEAIGRYADYFMAEQFGMFA
ncbi:MAG: PEP/pyruvate-binding domain-containing protein, partial [Thermodesulfobacteriota bacterium]